MESASYLFDCFDTRWGCERTIRVSRDQLLSRSEVQHYEIGMAGVAPLPHDLRFFVKKPRSSRTKLRHLHNLKRGCWILCVGVSLDANPGPNFQFIYHKIRHIQVSLVGTSDVLALEADHLGYTYSQLEPEFFQPVVNYSQIK